MAVNARAELLAQAGEDCASEYLRGLGWEILERNWRCRAGELDVIALEPSAQTVVFVEVKTRSSLGFGTPLEAITDEKVNRLRQLANIWLRANSTSWWDIRLDAVGIVMPRTGKVELTHIRGIENP